MVYSLHKYPFVTFCL
uniref:Uncharacterized protein n=1 Tax=Anguilla anguilla TaxID=7936 RepID=A0A0E9S950_ANGAN